MKLTSTISNNGQTTIPMEVLELLGWEPGQKIVYKIDESGVWIVAAKKSLMIMAGALASDMPTLLQNEERAVFRKAISGKFEKLVIDASEQI